MTILPGEIEAAKHTLEAAGVRFDRPVVGINTGGGGRWQFKRWTAEGFVRLARELDRRLGARIVLLGGPAEADFNRSLLDALDGIAVDAGSANPLRHFAALIACCDVLVTGDSLALHLALAAKTRVVALFGPTSAAEIDLYDLGEKLFSDLDCLCCYRQQCDRKPNCMDRLSVDGVYRAVSRQIDRL
jgi:heptosyltransferase-2